MPDTFDAWIRGRRAERRETQAELAERLQVSPWLVARWEKGLDVPVKVVHLSRLAEWSGVSISKLARLALDSEKEA